MREATIELDGDPNGLYWDAASHTLYMADDDNNRILVWTDADGFGTAIPLPEEPPEGAGLDELVRTADGTLVTPRFGFGTAGAVVFVNDDGTSGMVPGLDTEKRRIGLAVDGDTIYGAYFVSNMGLRVGAVTVLDLAGTERDSSIRSRTHRDTGRAMDVDRRDASHRLDPLKHDDHALRCRTMRA